MRRRARSTHAATPAATTIGDDVVQHDHQDVLFRRQPKQRDSKQLTGQVEGPPRLGLRLPRASLCARLPAARLKPPGAGIRPPDR